MNKAVELGQQVTALYDKVDLAIRDTIRAIFDKGKGSKENNDAFGHVIVVELREQMHLKQYKKIRGVAFGGNSGQLYLYIQDTSNGRTKGPFGGADYLLPFEEVETFSLPKMVTVLHALEKDLIFYSQQ